MEETPLWITALIVVLFVLLPIGISFLGAKNIYRVHRFRKGTERRMGTVVDIRQSTSQGGEDQDPTTLYQPMFEFSGPGGGLLRGETPTASANQNFQQGTEHAILVNFDEPGIVHMSGNRPYIFGLVMVCAGGVLAFFGLGVSTGLI
ncbi:MAG: hypothetical protein P1V21_14650 [Rhizobiaceae bacterium]|nr:hypothetical protein [Rhizobiaceae bacterium]